MEKYIEYHLSRSCKIVQGINTYSLVYHRSYLSKVSLQIISTVEYVNKNERIQQGHGKIERSEVLKTLAGLLSTLSSQGHIGIIVTDFDCVKTKTDDWHV